VDRTTEPTAPGLRFTIPAAPPSWNHAYRIARVNRHLTLVKTPQAKAYQEMVELIVKTARPSRWECPKEVFVVYRLALKRSMDSDNTLKLLNDAIARALGVDDRRFLPVVLERKIGVASPSTEVSLYDAATWNVRITTRTDDQTLRSTAT
jgi:Holliday junction resolvase RusA-like endonuclease